MDFVRGEMGEGRVIIRLSDPGVGVDVSSQGGKYEFSFPIPISLKRYRDDWDVSDFATPVLVVDALPKATYGLYD